MAFNAFRERQQLRWRQAEGKPRAARGPVPAEPPRRARKNLHEIARASWGHAGNAASTLIKVFGGITTALIFGVFFSSLLDRSVVIQPLSVPRPLADAGFTGDVASSVIRDKIHDLYHQAQTAIPQREILQQSDLLDISVPGVGISIQALRSQFRSFLGLGTHQTVSGELTLDSGALFVSLRLNGKAVFAGQGANSHAQREDLLSDAAKAVVKATQPCVYAAFLSENDKPAALTLTEAIVATSPEGSRDALQALNLRGTILDALGRTEEAIAAYRTVIARDPTYASPHNNLGNALSGLGQHAEAMAAYRAAIALDPKLAAPHYNLGVILAVLGQNEAAMAEYRAAIALDPRNAWPRFNMGVMLQAMGRHEAAATEYRLAIALNPKLAAPHHNLGAVLQSLGRDEAALGEYRAAIALDPSDPLPHAGLGAALHALGREEEAVAAYQAALALDPKDAASHRALGGALRALGRTDEALTEDTAAKILESRQRPDARTRPQGSPPGPD